MPTVTIQKNGPPLHQKRAYDLAGLVVWFLFCSLPDGRRGNYGTVSVTTEEAARLQARLNVLPEFSLVLPLPAPGEVQAGTASRPVDPVPVPAIPVEAEPAAPPAPHPAWAVARRNGWTDADLEGVGRGEDPGPGGGYSPRTGLSLGQMALSIPPDGWEEAAAHAYPWQINGWRPPGVAFTAPAVPAKPEAHPSDAAEGVLSEPPMEEEPGLDAVPAAEEGEEEPEDADLPAWVTTPEVRAVVDEAWPDRLTDAPSSNKIGYRLRKANLIPEGASYTAAIHAALVSALQAEIP